MAQLNFGGTTETVVIRDEFPLEKAREVLKNETIAVIGYGVQGPGQALNLRDNGFNVIVGQRQGKTYDKAVADGWVPGETLFGIEEACEKGFAEPRRGQGRRRQAYGHPDHPHDQMASSSSCVFFLPSKVTASFAFPKKRSESLNFSETSARTSPKRASSAMTILMPLG